MASAAFLAVKARLRRRRRARVGRARRGAAVDAADGARRAVGAHRRHRREPGAAPLLLPVAVRLRAVRAARASARRRAAAPARRVPRGERSRARRGRGAARRVTRAPPAPLSPRRRYDALVPIRLCCLRGMRARSSGCPPTPTRGRAAGRRVLGEPSAAGSPAPSAMLRGADGERDRGWQRAQADFNLVRVGPRVFALVPPAVFCLGFPTTRNALRARASRSRVFLDTSRTPRTSTPTSGRALRAARRRRATP